MTLVELICKLKSILRGARILSVSAGNFCGYVETLWLFFREIVTFLEIFGNLLQKKFPVGIRVELSEVYFQILTLPVPI